MQKGAKQAKTGWERIRELYYIFKVSSPYGQRGHVFHNGIDIKTPTGTPIQFKKGEYDNFFDLTNDIGGIQYIVTKGKLKIGLSHLNQKAQRDNNGNLFFYTGNTGMSTGPHLHLTTYIYYNGDWREIDPEKLIRDNWAEGRGGRIGKVDMNRVLSGDDQIGFVLPAVILVLGLLIKAYRFLINA